MSGKRNKVHKGIIIRIRSNKHIICEYIKKSSITLTKVIHPETEKALYKWFLNGILHHNVVNDNVQSWSKESNTP